MAATADARQPTANNQSQRSETSIETYALARVGSVTFGVPTAHVEQAIVRPPHTVGLPRSQAAISGVFTYRSQVVPTVDLRTWMHPPMAHTEPLPQVLVLRVGNRVLGLAIDAVQGLLKVATKDVQQVHQDDSANEFFHSVGLAEDRTSLVPLLDPNRLMAQAHVWASQSDQISNGADSANGLADNAGPTSTRAASSAVLTAQYALVRKGQAYLCFAASDVAEVLATPSVQKFSGHDDSVMGIARWRDRYVPLLNVLPALGLESDSKAMSAWLVVLQIDGMCVGVPVDEVCAVKAFPQANVQAAQGPALLQMQLCSQTVAMDSIDRAYLMDSTAIVHSCPLASISRAKDKAPPQRNTAHDHRLLSNTTSQGQDTAHANSTFGQAHIVFRAGLSLAAAMTQIQEIVSFPQDFRVGDAATPQYLGSFEWRGQSVPLIDLCLATGQLPIERNGNTRVMVIRLDAAHASALVGVVVQEVVALLPAYSGAHSRFSLQGGNAVNMITVGKDAAQRSYSIMNFGFLAPPTPAALQSEGNQQGMHI